MDHLIVVTHPEEVELEARPLHSKTPEDAIALGYYHDGNLVARGVVAVSAVAAINSLLAHPVTIALAAAEDEDGNIDARVCLVLPIDPDMLPGEGEEGPSEPWRDSVPALPPGIEAAATDSADPSKPKLALLPIGNVVRGHKDRRHPGDVTADVHEMLDNLIGGKARDAVRKAIDDLLNSL